VGDKTLKTLISCRKIDSSHVSYLKYVVESRALGCNLATMLYNNELHL
jgi:hypothetical protein